MLRCHPKMSNEESKLIAAELIASRDLAICKANLFASQNRNNKALINLFKKDIEDGLQLGIDLEWWESVDWGKKKPIPFPIVFLMSSREIREKQHDGHKLWITTHVLNETDNFAHMLSAIGIFKSISEAKKAGWNKPIEPGEFLFKKKGIRIRVSED